MKMNRFAMAALPSALLVLTIGPLASSRPALEVDPGGDGWEFVACNTGVIKTIPENTVVTGGSYATRADAIEAANDPDVVDALLQGHLLDVLGKLICDPCEGVGCEPACDDVYDPPDTQTGIIQNADDSWSITARYVGDRKIGFYCTACVVAPPAGGGN